MVRVRVRVRVRPLVRKQATDNSLLPWAGSSSEFSCCISLALKAPLASSSNPVVK